METQRALMLSEKDNVATSLADLEPGTDVQIQLGKEISTIKILENIPFGFKIAVKDINKGFNVMKYGEAIGLASQDIKQGQLAHIHNIEGARARGDLARGAS